MVIKCSILAGPEGEPEGAQQRPSLLVVRRRRGDGDVHAPDRRHLVVVDLREDQLFRHAEAVVAPAVERTGVETPEVTDPGQGHRQQPVEELPHPVTPHAEALERAPGLPPHRLLAGDDPQLVHCLVERLGFLDGLADAHVDHDLHEPRDRHDVQARLGHELGADLIDVAALEARLVAVRCGHGVGRHQASSPSHDRQMRIFVPSSATEKPTRVGPQLLQTSVTLDRSTGSSLVMMPPSWPPPRAEGRTFSWRFTRLTPSTSTRFLVGRAAMTRPSLPASLPARTWTRSPLRTRAATRAPPGRAR